MTSLPDGVIEIHTDGACSGNPGPGGWGAIIREGSHQQEISGGEESTTNNRMEMMAAIEALKTVKKNRPVTLFTDSTYLMDGLTKWIKGWKKRGWKTAGGKPVKNKDLWLLLDALTQGGNVTWQWVKGHAGDPLNERADLLAREAIPGSVPGKEKKSQDGAAIKKTFSDYAAAFTTFDKDAVVSFWSFPAMISVPGQTKLFETEQEFLANLERVMGHYAHVGMARVEATVSARRALTDKTCAVQVTYALFDQHEKKITGWKHGYVLRNIGDDWRILSAIADEELKAWSRYKD